MADDKEHLNLVTIGHVDHGKSTLVGRLLWDTDNIPEEQMRKIEEQAEEHKKETFQFAFVMDSLKEERERGVTIDVMHKRFDTDQYYYTIIDAPGHRDFVKNMITGTSQADAAVLVVSAKDGAQAQTKEHSYLAKVLGVDDVIVAINKMDEVDYSQDTFEDVREEVSEILKGIGYDPSGITFIPISAYEGDNVAEQSDNMEWYDGPTVLESLDAIEPPTKPEEKPLRMPVQDVYSITGVGTVPVGRIETGRMNKGDKITFMPSNVQGEVKSIEMHHEDVPEAGPGDNVGVNVRGVDKEQIKKGDVIGTPDSPPTVAKQFEAQIIVLNHPNVITEGYTPVFHCHTAQIACRITDLQKKIDPQSGETLEENPDLLKTGDAAIVTVQPTQPLVLESQQEFPEMARFAIRDMGQTVAAGVCLDVESG